MAPAIAATARILFRMIISFENAHAAPWLGVHPGANSSRIALFREQCGFHR
jgi:hypothetical protein